MVENNITVTHVYLVQILLAISLVYGSQSITSGNYLDSVLLVIKYIVYMLTIKGSQEVCVSAQKVLDSNNKLDVVKKIFDQNKKHLLIFLVCVSFSIFCGENLLRKDFILLFIAYLINKYPEMEQEALPPTINYGVGMACSYFEGYLAHILPSDGAGFVGFEENINIYEANNGVVFPVKRLFIIITKSLYCPPDLKQFNKKNRDDLPWLEACRSLENVKKDVAGVKNRSYRNSAYKIKRPNATTVYLAMECATPLHTLHKVLEKRYLYEKLVDADVPKIVDDFCTTLRSVVQKSHECRDKCELVFFDDTDPNQNLADVLLDKIRELEPNFENIIKRQPN